MANHLSSKKRIRQTETRTLRNRHVRTTVRSSIKATRLAIEAGDAGKAKEALGQSIRLVEKAVSKGVYHRKTGSRYISRLSKQVNAL